MKRVRFRDPSGAVRTGEWDDGTITFADRTYDAADDAIDVLSPTEPTKVVCVGRNYAAHAAEFDAEVPDRPSLFLKPPNTVAGHGDRIPLPRSASEVHYEAELAVVIGEQCRRVDAEAAESVIAGYTCAVDLSNRDDQRREQNWVRGKAFDGSAPMGPVVAESIPEDATIELRVNGERRQHDSIDRLHFGVPTLIAEITEHMTLEQGDVIMTGTPEGVGPLADGDTVAVTIEGIGRLEHTVIKE